MLSLNCCSLRSLNKRGRLQALILENQLHIIIGCESHIDDTYPTGEIFPTDFSVIRKDRTSGGGGVFLAFTKNLKFTEQPNLSQNAEMIWAEIYPVSNESCLVCSFYRPPDALSSPILSLKEALQHISRTKGNQTNIKTHGSVSCGLRNRGARNGVSILTGTT